jgi:protein-S-isoprenylcysteine O-methyltransferase Ste14
MKARPMRENELPGAAGCMPEATPSKPPSKAQQCDLPVEMPPKTSLRYATGNVFLALTFFLLIPAKGQYHSAIANDIWIVGAGLMGALSLVRLPPRSAMVDARAILATGAMMIIPALMRPGTSSTGVFADVAIVFEFIGIAFTQIARLYLGRHFGLLPANRGIVTGGPYRLMRHPIYSGWLLLILGYVMAYSNSWNIGIPLLSLPFLIWRIDLEEKHLSKDPEYHVYLAKTPYRLIPCIY